jgi:hypothetical protein
MPRFVEGRKKLGHEAPWKACIVNYADDLGHRLSSGSGASSARYERVFVRARFLDPLAPEAIPILRSHQ